MLLNQWPYYPGNTKAKDDENSKGKIIIKNVFVVSFVKTK